MHALRVHGQQQRQFRYEQAPDPSPGIGDVLVEVAAASFTPTELDWPSTWVDRAGRDRSPVIPGHEVSGTVRSLGYGTTGLAVGDAVYGLTDWYRDGATAGYMTVEARDLAAKPVSATHPQAASLPLAGLTAWQALFVHGGLEPGQTVVITGASGGVGTLAVQLARHAGARVVAVARGWARDRLDDLGASEFVDAAGPEASGVKDADLLVDLVGGQLAARCAAMIHAGGTVVSAVDSEPSAPAGTRSVFFVVEPDRPQLTELARLVDSGQIHPVVAKLVPMADGAAEAFGAKHAGGLLGKVVLQPS
ncbi:MAG TPA: NADP-dependent oxidoreductase [Streptosporangiaceae bacterium]|jgi:NADPH:quinone reductase-like Zn-dependent oxidoreductase